MKIEILWAIFLVTTAFGAVVARDFPPWPDLEVDDLMISEEELAKEYSNYTADLNINSMRDTGLACQYDGKYGGPCDHDYKTNCGFGSNIPCRDHYPECAQWAKDDLCNLDWRYSVLCRFSCACGVGTKIPCIDIDHHECTQWAKDGLCKDWWYSAHCRSSCACGVGSNIPCNNDLRVDRLCKQWADKEECNNDWRYSVFCRSSCACEVHLGAAPVIPPPAVCSCGIADDKNRIIGGVTVDPEQKWPWVVGLRYWGFWGAKKKQILAGGSIINSKYVLTAAHHFRRGQPLYYTTNLFVHIGEHDQKSTKEDDMGNNMLIRVDREQIFIHPCHNQKEDYDFALLGLTVPIVFNSVITPVCLPKDDSKIYVGKEAKVAGWGDTQSYWGKSPPVLLQELGMTIVDNKECGDFDTLYGTGIINPSKLCATVPNDWTKNTCVWDSGSTLVVKDPKGSSRHVAVGVVSFGQFCNVEGYAKVFGRVSKVLDWIKAKAATGQYCEK